MNNSLGPGQIVYSVKGRDEGRVYMVLEIKEDRFAHLVDGVYRKLENPKVKNVKHLEMTGAVIESILEKIEEGKPLQDSEIIRYIREFQEKKIREMIECPSRM